MSISFEHLTPGDLAEAAVVPQVLDNQWVPSKLLPNMIKKGKGLEDKGIKNKRKKYIRKEWRRALIYGEQVVVNRAFMFNNDIVVDDYDDKKSRKHFKNLLNDRVIVPYLFKEESPDEKPKFEVAEKKWNAWLEILKDTYPGCVRLNWDDQKLDFTKMSSAFHRYIKNLDTPGLTDDLATYLKIHPQDIPAFKNRLFNVVDFVTSVGRNDEFVTRNMLYEKFVISPGTPVDAGVYGNGPFSGEIKQIFDLKYNVNLPDALGRYSLTPEDSLPRSALGDLDEALRTDFIDDKNMDKVLRALQQLNFEKISKGLYINGLGSISLGDVIEIRRMDEWEQYISSIRNLLKHPFDFIDASNKVYLEFEALNRAISKHREDRLTERWDPWIKLTLAIGLSAVELWINPNQPSEKLITQLGTGAVAAGFTPVLMKLTISAMNQKNNADLDMSIDFMRGTVRNGQSVWNEVFGRLASTPGFKKLEQTPISVDEANQSQPVIQKDLEVRN